MRKRTVTHLKPQSYAHEFQVLHSLTQSTLFLSTDEEFAKLVLTQLTQGGGAQLYPDLLAFLQGDGSCDEEEDDPDTGAHGSGPGQFDHRLFLSSLTWLYRGWWFRTESLGNQPDPGVQEVVGQRATLQLDQGVFGTQRVTQPAANMFLTRLTPDFSVDERLQ